MTYSFQKDICAPKRHLFTDEFLTFQQLAVWIMQSCIKEWFIWYYANDGTKPVCAVFACGNNIKLSLTKWLKRTHFLFYLDIVSSVLLHIHSCVQMTKCPRVIVVAYCYAGHVWSSVPVVCRKEAGDISQLGWHSFVCSFVFSAYFSFTLHTVTVETTRMVLSPSPSLRTHTRHTYTYTVHVHTHTAHVHTRGSRARTHTHIHTHGTRTHTRHTYTHTHTQANGRKRAHAGMHTHSLRERERERERIQHSYFVPTGDCVSSETACLSLQEGSQFWNRTVLLSIPRHTDFDRRETPLSPLLSTHLSLVLSLSSWKVWRQCDVKLVKLG